MLLLSAAAAAVFCVALTFVDLTHKSSLWYAAAAWGAIAGVQDVAKENFWARRGAGVPCAIIGA